MLRSNWQNRNNKNRPGSHQPNILGGVHPLASLPHRPEPPKGTFDDSVNFVFLAGDLCDGDWKDYNTGLYFSERMVRLREAGIRVFIVAGNHDAASQITKHKAPSLAG